MSSPEAMSLVFVGDDGVNSHSLLAAFYRSNRQALLLNCVTGTLLCTIHIIYLDLCIQDVQLVPGTTAYDTFEEMPVPIRMQYWVWNIVNPDEFLNGAKPIMEQRGPYTYL